MKNILPVFFFLIFINGLAQQQFTINGSITDAATGESLPGVNVYLKSNPQKGVVSNYYGYYALRLPAGNYTLIFSYLGYETKEVTVDLQKDYKLDVKLTPAPETLNEVVITQQSKVRNVHSTVLGTHRLSVKAIENLPVLLGEKDIIKILQLLPGVKPAGEGQSGFYVRGGNIDENLILLDEAPVYNASHLLGFFSVFNSDAISSVRLFKGHIPARYGSRLSSVLEVRMKEGNNQELHGQGGIGLISSRFTLEAPIIKNKASFLISGRRTYADLLMKAISNDEDVDNTSLYFYDLNLKTNWRVNQNNRLFLSGYFGRDVFGFDDGDDQFVFSWGNATTTLRFNHIFNSRLFSNTSLIFSDYNYRIKLEEKGYTDFFFNLGAGIQDWTLKNDFNYYLNDRHKMNFGLDMMHHTLKPSTFETSDYDDEISLLNLTNRYALENAIYVSDEFSFSNQLKIYLGLRYTHFIHLGGGNFTKYDTQGNVEFTKHYDRWQAVKTFHGLAPRFNVSYTFDDNQSVKAAFAKTYQFLHLMTNSSSSNPTDVWMPSGLNIPAQTSYQTSLGYFRNLKDGLLEFSAEAYYKTMQNVVDYKTGTRITLNPEVEKYLLYGQGKAYGLELLLRKKQGKLKGWISYTLSRSLKQFDKINNGKWFSARQDRIHDVSVVLSYKLSPRIDLGAVWVYYTGNAVTFPAGFYQIDGREYPYFTERNGGRMPDYHRLDLSFTLHNKPGKKFRSSWSFAVYNAYGQLNPYIIYFQQDWENNSFNLKAKQITLFRWVPSITYNFKF